GPRAELAQGGLRFTRAGRGPVHETPRPFGAAVGWLLANGAQAPRDDSAPKVPRTFPSAGPYFNARTPNASGRGTTFLNPTACSLLTTPWVVRLPEALLGSPM